MLSRLRGVEQSFLATEMPLNYKFQKAQGCVYAARGMMTLLPNEPSAVALYRIGSWWCRMHLMMQASTILMLEMVHQSCHMPRETDSIVKTIKKVVSWLRSMAEDNKPAKQAWKMSVDLLKQVAHIVHADISDVVFDEARPLPAPTGVPEPPRGMPRDLGHIQTINSIDPSAFPQAMQSRLAESSQHPRNHQSSQAFHVPQRFAAPSLQQSSGPAPPLHEVEDLQSLMQSQQPFDPNFFFDGVSMNQNSFDFSQADTDLLGVPMYTSYDQFGPFRRAVSEPQICSTFIEEEWFNSGMYGNGEDTQDP